MRLFSKIAANAKCYVFYFFDFDRRRTKGLFQFLLHFFADRNIAFDFMSYYNECYDIKYGKFEKIKSKVEAETWSELAHFGFYDKDLRDPTRSIGVEFDITRPNVISIVLRNEIIFDTREFCRVLSDYVKSLYGFRYSVDMNEWSAAYANGDWQHSDGVYDIKRKSKNHLQRWNKNCELIKEGLLRDIYHENILTKVQLSRPIKTISLENYIIRNEMGKLDSINSEIFFWDIDEDNKLNEIRDQLYSAEIVI